MKVLIAGQYVPTCEWPASRRREGVVHVRTDYPNRATLRRGQARMWEAQADAFIRAQGNVLERISAADVRRRFFAGIARPSIR